MSHLRHGKPPRIRGWGLIKARGARLAQRRYMILHHHNLSVYDSSDENTALLVLEEHLVGAQVTSSKRRREVVMKFPTNDKIVVQVKTDKEFTAWSSGFYDAARVAADYYKLVETRELGRGAFSTVYFGFDRENGDHVAIKVVDKMGCKPTELAYAETEARMMAYVRHPSIILCRDIFDSRDHVHVIMEYMSGSTLEERMLGLPPEERCFSEQVTATIMSHILDALAYLDEENICHRDVKPENILLSSVQNDKHWATSARLSDFGLAAFIETDLDLTDIVGTPNYVAPEVTSRDASDNERLGYGPPVDAWAAGVSMYWMVTGGRLPFDGPDNGVIFKNARSGKLDLDSPPWNNISEECKSLIKGLLCRRPMTRLRAIAARTHPWMLKSKSPTPIARLAWEYRNKNVRRAHMTWRQRFRGAVKAVIAYNVLAEVIDEQWKATQRQVRSERIKNVQRSIRKTSVEDRMQRAPEQAPAGADGLGYNIGLFPSFAPKRRAKANVSPGPRDGSIDRGATLRSSKESRRSKEVRTSKESSSSGSRGPSGDRGSLDRSSGGKGGWGFRRKESG